MALYSAGNMVCSIIYEIGRELGDCFMLQHVYTIMIVIIEKYDSDNHSIKLSSPNLFFKDATWQFVCSMQVHLVKQY